MEKLSESVDRQYQLYYSCHYTCGYGGERMQGQTLTGAEVRAETYRAILRHRGSVFQTATIREELGWAEQSSEAHRMHGVIQDLKRSGILEQTGTKRKRNQYLMIVPGKEGELRSNFDNLRAISGNGKATSPSADKTPKPAGPRRVQYLEERVEALEQQEGNSEVLKLLREISTKLDDLHREWVGS
jgi:hypothetical protein